MELPSESPVVLAMYEAAAGYERGPSRHYLGMSSIGGPCARALWYRFRGFTPSAIDGRAKMIFSLGDAVEDEVVKWMTMAGYPVTDRQRAFQELGGYFCGHWDGCVEGITKRPHVLEIKSANDKRFKAFQQAGCRAVSPQYYCQMQCYMGYSGLERALFVVMNKNTCELYAERVYFNRAEFQAIEERARSIILASEPPPLTGTSGCEWCDFRARCQSEDGYIQTTKTCGTCTYCQPETGEDGQPAMHCTHRTHAFTLKNWGASCADWHYIDNREGL